MQLQDLRRQLKCVTESSQAVGRFVTPNNALERACRHRGRAALAMDGVLVGAELTSCPAAQLNR
jgi:hypothetical protein